MPVCMYVNAAHIEAPTQPIIAGLMYEKRLKAYLSQDEVHLYMIL